MERNKGFWLAMLEHSYVQNYCGDEQKQSRLEYLSDMIFDFTTYDGEASELFARKAIEVCEAVNDGATFDYIKEPDSYRWYLIMCNMPFFNGRLEWGTSIRGAWWDTWPDCPQTLNSCGLFQGDKQVLDLTFEPDEWKAFVEALIEFAKPHQTLVLQPIAE